MSKLMEVKGRDFSLLIEPDRESVEILITILTPSFQITIPKTMPKYIWQGYMTLAESN